MDLFEAAAEKDLSGAPLAARMRPRTLDDVVGQDHLTGEKGFLTRMLKRGRVPSVILWGPPGTGKTTIAEVLCETLDMRMVRLSAVLAGVKDIRAAIDEAKRARAERGRATLLFVDEIHRFNKSQQDALLPHVERGTVTLIGATTENPSFEVNAALLSRSRVLVTRAIDEESLRALVDRALTDVELGLGELELTIAPNAEAALIQSAAGDARRMLTALEVAADLAVAEDSPVVEEGHVGQAVAKRIVLFDKSGDAHYNVVSAFIKSMRGSDPDAALHYLARMLEAGEEPRFIVRRMVIFASEDVGNADPHALTIATSALHAFELVGLPEGALVLGQACIYLACAPKSNASYKAIGAARKDVLEHPGAEIPKHILNAPTGLMKSLGYGDGYQYPHDFEGNHVREDYLPEQLSGRRYYHPTENGVEARIKARLEKLRGK